jgi:nucleotide-binding universal stress UspA family protein
MYTDLIIGFDGSAPGRDALAFGQRLAAATGARPTVVCVHPFMSISADVPAEEEINLGWRDGAEATLDEARSELADVPGAAFRSIADPSPAHALHQVAEEVDAALIVLGSTHRSGLGRVLPGTTADLILQAAPCAVAIAPAGYAARAPHALGVVGAAVDGGDESRRIARVAARIAQGGGATLRLITVVDTHYSKDPLYAGQVGNAALVDAIRDTATGTLEQTAAAIGGTQVKVERKTREGAADEELVAESGELDLLIVGSRGFGPLRRIVLGSVSTKVVRAAACPVIVLPRHAAEQLDEQVASLAAEAAAS